MVHLLHASTASPCSVSCDPDSRFVTYVSSYVPEKTRNSSGDEIANVNFLYDDIVHALENANAIDSCINSATDRFLQHRFTKVREITQCNGHYAVQSIQGHRFGYQSKAHIRLPISD